MTRTSPLQDQGSRRLLLAVILGAAVALMAIAYLVLQDHSNAPMAFPRDVDPDTLVSCRLKPKDHELLATLQEQKNSVRPDSLHAWARDRFWPLQSLGLRLLEQATLFKHIGRPEKADQRIATAEALAASLIQATNDSFLLRQIAHVRNLSGEALARRAQVSMAYDAAQTLFRQGHSHDAERMFEKAYTLAREADDKLLVEAGVWLLWYLGLRDRDAEAVDIGQEVIPRARRIGYRKRLAEALLMTADAAWELDHRQEAMNLLERAEPIVKTLRDPRTLARLLYNRADKHYRLGEYREAEALLAAVANLEGDHKFTGVVESLSGQISLLRGEYGGASEAFEKALRYFEGTGEVHNQVAALDNLSTVKRLLGEYEASLALGRKALSLIEVEHYPDLGLHLLSTLGVVYTEMDSLDQAIQTYREGMRLFHSSATQGYVARLWLSLGNTQLKRGDIEAALQAFRHADVTARKADVRIITIEANLARGSYFLESGRLNEARDVLQTALDHAREIGDPSLVRDAFYGLSRCARKAGRHQEALALVEEAISVAERLRTNIHSDLQRVSYFATNQELFDHAISLGLEAGHVAYALLYAERAKNRALLDALGATNGTAISDHHADFLLHLVTRIEDLRDDIPPNVQVLEYRTMPDSLLVWLVNPKRISVTAIPISSDSLTAKADRFLTSLGARDLPRFRKRVQANPAAVYEDNVRFGRELYDVVLAPIESQLNRENLIVIIADGVLHKIPFGALVDGRRRFFDETHVWAKAPSLTILSRLRRQEAAVADGNARFLMVAGELPSVPQEKKSIRNSFDDVTILEGARATYGHLKRELSKGASVVYFSSHAVADESHPMNSYIELYEVNLDDHRLEPKPAYARRLLDLEFSGTQLAVLNACETAHGKLAAGEGVLNLVRIFCMAQVPTVVASLWKNDDRQSYLLMRDFFAEIAGGRCPPAALHLAKKRTLKRLRRQIIHPLPYFWSVFEAFHHSWDAIPAGEGASGRFTFLERN